MITGRCANSEEVVHSQKAVLGNFAKLPRKHVYGSLCFK